MTHTKLTMIVTAIALGLIAGTATAGKRGHRRGDHFRGDKMHRYADLELTESQQQQIAQIREKARNDSKTLRDKIRKLEEQQRAEWLKETPTKGALITLNRQIHDIKQKLGEHRIDTRLKTAAVLTKEQQVKMKTRMKNRPDDGKGRMLKGKHRGDKMGKRDKRGEKSRLSQKGHKPGRGPVAKNRGHKRHQRNPQCVDTRLI